MIECAGRVCVASGRVAVRVLGAVYHAFYPVVVEVEYPHAVAGGYVAFVVVVAGEGASVALHARGVYQGRLIEHLHCSGVGHGDAASGDGGARVAFLLGYEIETSPVDGSVLVGAAQLFSRICFAEYAVVPVVAVGVVGMEEIDA